MVEHDRREKYAYLDQLSTPELEKLLRADAESPESGDDEAIFYIWEVIARREPERLSGPCPDVEQSWKDFQAVYNTPEGRDQTLYPAEAPEELPKKSALRRHMPRRPVLVAAVMVILVALLAVPVSGRDNILEIIGKWTAEQFSFFSTDSRENEGRLPLAESFEDEQEPGQELRELLLEYGIEEDVVPHWLPEGFSLQGTVKNHTQVVSDNLDFSAFYDNGTDSLSINIVKYSTQPQKSIYEKTSNPPEIFLSHNIEHYIIQNSSSITAAWYVGNLECSINTTLPKTDLKEILDSIYY